MKRIEIAGNHCLSNNRPTGTFDDEPCIRIVEYESPRRLFSPPSRYAQNRENLVKKRRKKRGLRLIRALPTRPN